MAKKPRLTSPKSYIHSVPDRYYTTGRADGKTKHYGAEMLPAIPPGFDSAQITVFLSKGETAWNPECKRKSAYEGPGKVVYILYGDSCYESKFSEK